MRLAWSKTPKTGFLMLRLIYQSHGNFCDPVFLLSFLLLIFKFKTYTSSACSNLAQEFSVPSTVICYKEAWTPGLDHVQRSDLPSWFDIRAWLHYDEAKDLTFCH